MRTISEIKRVVYEDANEEAIDTIRLTQTGWTVKDGEYDEQGNHIIEWERWEQEEKDPDIDDLVTYPTFFQLLYALGISADEWECGVIDENISDLHDYDTDNINELGLTAGQRQMILATLKGAIVWETGMLGELDFRLDMNGDPVRLGDTIRYVTVQKGLQGVVIGFGGKDEKDFTCKRDDGKTFYANREYVEIVESD